MTRIGRIKSWDSKDQGQLRFRLVMEEGRLTLGCWRYVADEEERVSWMPRRSIFERVS
jgi:hypothetical protein